MADERTDEGVPTNPVPESVVEHRGGCAWWALLAAVLVIIFIVLWWVLGTNWGRDNPTAPPVPGEKTPVGFIQLR